MGRANSTLFFEYRAFYIVAVTLLEGDTQPNTHGLTDGGAPLHILLDNSYGEDRVAIEILPY